MRSGFPHSSYAWTFLTSFTINCWLLLSFAHVSLDPKFLSASWVMVEHITAHIRLASNFTPSSDCRVWDNIICSYVPKSTRRKKKGVRATRNESGFPECYDEVWEYSWKWHCKSLDINIRLEGHCVAFGFARFKMDGDRYLSRGLGRRTLRILLQDCDFVWLLIA